MEQGTAVATVAGSCWEPPDDSIEYSPLSYHPWGKGAVVIG